LKVVAALVIPLFIMSIVLEIGSRIIIPVKKNQEGSYIEDEEVIFTLRPMGEFEYRFVDNSKKIVEIKDRISSQGIRDREYGPKEPDEYRIVTIGDSYTMGHGIKREEMFQRELETLLARDNLSKRVTVINCGVGGYAPWQERVFLQTRGFGFEPDLVILQLYPANDVSGSYTKVGKWLNAIDLEWETLLIDYRLRSEWPFYLEHWCQVHSNIYRIFIDKTGINDLVKRTALNFRLIPKVNYSPPHTQKFQICLYRSVSGRLVSGTAGGLGYFCRKCPGNSGRLPPTGYRSCGICPRQSHFRNARVLGGTEQENNRRGV
jgi:hypothetical protein